MSEQNPNQPFYKYAMNQPTHEEDIQNVKSILKMEETNRLKEKVSEQSQRIQELVEALREAHSVLKFVQENSTFVQSNLPARIISLLSRFEVPNQS